MKIDISINHSHHQCNCISCITRDGNKLINELLKKDPEGVIFCDDAKNYPTKKDIQTLRNDELLRKTKDDALPVFHEGKGNCGECCMNCGSCRYGV